MHVGEAVNGPWAWCWCSRGPHGAFITMLQKGEVLVDIKPASDGWLFGRVQGSDRTGLLPANYVKLIEDEDSAA